MEERTRTDANGLWLYPPSGLLKGYGLKDQITRASVSIMNNIAEGFDGGSNAEFIRFLGYAQRSATEVKSCLYVALDNKYITDIDFKQAYSLADEAKSLIGGFIKYLKSIDN